ncbi:MAG: rhodanese-like domain-containing protein [Bacteroidales bacterium]
MKKQKILFAIPVMLMIVISSCSKEKQYATADEWVADVQRNLTTITVEELKTKIDDLEMFYLLDVRESQEHYPGFIPGSVNAPGGVLIFKMESHEFWKNQMSYTPQKEDEIIVYCKKGKRSVVAAESLNRLGYTNVKYLDGGWKKWELTYPLEYDKDLDKLNHGGSAKEAGGC